MYKNVQANPKISQKLTQHSCRSMLTLENFQSNKRQWISFHPQRWDVPYRNHHACCEKLWFARTLYPNLPQMGQIFYHNMLMPLHDSMPSFMNFRRVLDLQEFKNQVSNVCSRVMVAGGLTFIPTSCMGPKHAPKDTYLIFQLICMHWSMRMQFKFELCT